MLPNVPKRRRTGVSPVPKNVPKRRRTGVSPVPKNVPKRRRTGVSPVPKNVPKRRRTGVSPVPKNVPKRRRTGVSPVPRKVGYACILRGNPAPTVYRTAGYLCWLNLAKSCSRLSSMMSWVRSKGSSCIKGSIIWDNSSSRVPNLT